MDDNMPEIMSERTSRKSRIFYRWFVVAAAFAVTLVDFGSAYTFSSFVASWERDFGAALGSVSLVFSFNPPVRDAASIVPAA
jgi:hypothetical protein